MDYNTFAKYATNPDNQVGTISKKFGTNGEVVVKLWDTFPTENLLEPFWVTIDSLPVPIFISSFETQGTSKAVIVFDDFQTEKLADMLIGKALYSHLVEPEEEEEMELIGYSFEDTTSQIKGEIVDFIDSEMNPLLEVEVEGAEDTTYIPYNQKFIKEIKNHKTHVIFTLPEGIFELNQ